MGCDVSVDRLTSPLSGSRRLGRKLQRRELGDLRFSIEYLRRQQLLDREGRPVGYAGLVSHLYWTEPANFVFYSILNSGLLADICKTEAVDRESTSCALLLLSAPVTAK